LLPGNSVNYRGQLAIGTELFGRCGLGFLAPPASRPGNSQNNNVLAFSAEGSEKATLGNFGMSRLHTELLYPAASLVVALAGAVTDLRDRRVPNRLTFPAILFGLLLHFSMDGWKGLGQSAAAGLIAGVIFLIFWLAGGMGAGDVKLITAVACIAGLSHVFWLLALTAVAGGVMAIGLALWRGRLKETILNLGALAVHHRFEGLKPHPNLNVGNTRTLRLPYALAIAAGSAITVCMTVVQR
jgi:prepilin peptidase CpaA